MRYYFFAIPKVLIVIFFFVQTESLFAQIDDPFKVVVSNGDVYLYVLESPAGNFALNVYRKDGDDSDFQLLNEEPVRGVVRGEQLKVRLGNRYDEIRRNADVTSEAALFSRVRSSSMESMILSLSYPDLAQAVNKLYIDRNSPVGEEVEYRLEVLNNRDEPTGTTYHKRLVVEDHLLGQTDILDITNEGSRVTVEWDYTPVADDDMAFRFNVFTKDQDAEDFRRVNREIILRNLEFDTFSYTFNVPGTGRDIEVRVGSVSVTSDAGPLSEPVIFTVEDNIAPAVIQNVRTSLTADSVQVQWRVSRELDAAGYNVYRGTESDGEFQQLNSELIPVQQPYFFDGEIVQGRRYLYRVTAVDESGNESEKSIAVPRIVPDNTPPPAPVDLIANLTNDQKVVELNWAMPEVPNDFRNFIVLRRVMEGRSPSVNYSQITDRDLRESNYIDRGRETEQFEEGALYRYGVVAADSSRNFSDTTFVDIRIPNVTPPEPPNVVRAQNRDGIRVNINWSGSLSRDVGSYNLYRKSSEGEFVLSTELGADARMFRDEEVNIGDTYIYAISAVDTTGNESERVETSSVLVKRSNPPRRVRNVRAVQTSEGARIRWEPVASEHLAGYRVYAANRSTGNFEPVHEELLSETTLTTNVGSEMIWFRVTALDNTGNESRPSEPVRLIVP